MDLDNLVNQYKTGEITVDKFVESASNVSWGNLEWGSCQYDTACAMFKTLELLNEHGYDPTEVIGWGPINSLVKLRVIKKDVLLKIIDDRLENVKEYLEDDPECYTEELELLKNERTKVETTNVNDVKDLDKAFVLLKESSWDLWSAAAVISSASFCTDFSNLKSVKSKGVGPILNVQVQSGNYLTGLQCYMLFYHGYVTDPDESFSGFDT